MSYFPHAPAVAFGPSSNAPTPVVSTPGKGQESLPFFCSEVYFSAWYNAHVNGKDPKAQKALPSSLDHLPSMLSKGQMFDGRKSAGLPMTTSAVLPPTMPPSKKVNPKLHQQMASLQAAHLEIANSLNSGGSPAKSMPIHCIVEQAAGCNGEKKAEVDMDTYAILPSTTLFNEIIRVALIKLGYSVVEAMGAKGAIQIKNWKPLTFDTITDYPDSTVEEILGDLTSIATLRIRLCSRSKLNALEDVKEKLLQFLIQHSQGMLQSIGCPIEKSTLHRICKGDYPLNLPDEQRQAFEKWFKDQTQKREPGAERGPPKDNRYDPTNGQVPGSYPTIRNELSLSMNALGSGGFMPKTRIRTSFDPEHEIPRLHRWFQQNQHPSREQMVVYLNELNSLESRRGRKPLDLTNIIYWFKNARAAQRRANRSGDLLGDDPSMDVEDSNDDHEGEPEQEGDRLSPVSAESVPVLPNKNAVYVVSSPLHHPPQSSHVSSRSNSPVIHIIPQDPSDLTEHSEHTGTNGLNNNIKEDIVENGLDQPHHPPYQHPPPNHHPHHSDADMEAMDEGRENGRDFSRQRSESMDSRASPSAGSDRDRLDSSGSGQSSTEEFHKAHPKMEIKQEMDHAAREIDYPSPPATSTPSPQQHMLALTSPQPPPAHQSHPMAMTAIPHPMNLHYMHPAAAHALYAGLDSSSLLNSHSHYKDSTPLSAEERKKRSRVFIDPLTEIPKLEKWFAEDTHPSSYMIEKYTEELNRSEYRQRFPKLEPKNVQLWFKNHRAKVKRGRLEQSPSISMASV